MKEYGLLANFYNRRVSFDPQHPERTEYEEISRPAIVKFDDPDGDDRTEVRRLQLAGAVFELGDNDLSDRYRDAVKARQDREEAQERAAIEQAAAVRGVALPTDNSPLKIGGEDTQPVAVPEANQTMSGPRNDGGSGLNPAPGPQGQDEDLDVDDKYDTMPYPELQQEAKNRGLPASGSAQQLQARLREDDANK